MIGASGDKILSGLPIDESKIVGDLATGLLIMGLLATTPEVRFVPICLTGVVFSNLMSATRVFSKSTIDSCPASKYLAISLSLIGSGALFNVSAIAISG